MHRSRLSMFAILAAVAACATRDDSDTRILSQDPTLVATLDVREKTPRPPLPDACGTVASIQPAARDKPQAAELARKAYDAELLGNPQAAQSLLRRASELDGTDKLAAYHLGRTSEAVGDRTSAVTAYCRYLTLAPTTAESVEARQRVARLSQSATRVAASSVANSAPTGGRGPAARVRRTVREEPGVAGRVSSASAGWGGADDGMNASTNVGGRASHTADGEVVAASPGVPTADQLPAPSRTVSRGPSRAQSAGIGAVAGAIIGAATGRSVKSTVIGAAAGGVLGAVVGGGLRPDGSR
jgi:hypothetical protein